MARHDPETKARALELLADASKTYTDVHKDTGIAVGTLHGWAKTAGIERSGSKTAETTRSATEARRAKLEARRTKLGEKLLRYAEKIADRAYDIANSDSEITDRSGEGTGFFVARARDAKDLMTTAAIAFDKSQLINGEPTAINENRVDPSRPRETLEGKLDQLAVKRQQHEEKTA